MRRPLLLGGALPLLAASALVGWPIPEWMPSFDAMPRDLPRSRKPKRRKNAKQAAQAAAKKARKRTKRSNR